MAETKIAIAFRLNGRPVDVEIGAHESLVEVLRRRFHLYGARESCGQGLCGTCTVILNGKAVSGCLTLAVAADGADVTTIEGLGTPEDLHPIQEAFVERSGFQCGFCTPGMVLMTKQLLDENQDPSDDQIKHYLTGNLCRCATYPEIIKSVKSAAEKVRTGGDPA
jgi:aerobic carbon-monoxide dehydrogenase small subunit